MLLPGPVRGLERLGAIPGYVSFTCRPCPLTDEECVSSNSAMLLKKEGKQGREKCEILDVPVSLNRQSKVILT